MKILIIEDELEISSFLKKGLEAELFSVEIASDGERGAFLARTGFYNLIILDSALPKMSGPEIIKELRKEKIKTPILMLSVKNSLNDKKESFNLGADDYLTKPFLFDELLLRVRALLKRPPLNQTNIKRMDNLSLDKTSGRIKRGGVEIYLTKKEFSLLEYFMDNPDKIISRSQILENVWDYNADPFSNSIETHITSLRRKLKPLGLDKKKSRELIHTFSGRGYKFSNKKLY